jgi:hypothetical protein
MNAPSSRGMRPDLNVDPFGWRLDNLPALDVSGDATTDARRDGRSESDLEELAAGVSAAFTQKFAKRTPTPWARQTIRSFLDANVDALVKRHPSN